MFKKIFVFLNISIFILNLIFYFSIVKDFNFELGNLEKEDYFLEIKRVEENLELMKKNLVMPTKLIDKILPSLVEHESFYDIYAIDKYKESFGIAQVQVPTANEVLYKSKLSKEDLMNPFINLFIATLFLNKLDKQYKSNVDLILARYSGGLKYGKIINKAKYGDSIKKKAAIK